MEWSGDGIIIATRRHGETAVIADLMTRERGRVSGLVNGGRGRTLRPVLQPGNSVRATWRARLEEHLGTLRVEPLRLRAAQIMETAHGVYALQTLCAHLRLLPERDAHPRLHGAFEAVLDLLGEPALAAESVVRFELALLDELGVGLDLSRCAATGVSDDLIYVSPRSGRAVSRDGGADYADRLLRLPAFIRGTEARVETADPNSLADGFALTGHFLDRHVWTARGIDAPPERERLIAIVTKGNAA